MNTSFFKRLLGFGQETNFKKYKNDTELLVKNRLRRSLGLPEFGAGASRSSVAARFFIASLVGLMVVLPAARAFAAAYVTLDSFSGNPTTLHASGGGWASGETVSIYLGSTAGSPAASASADAGGSFGPASVVVPPSTPEGALPIIAIGSEKGQRADNSYYVVHFSASVTAESSLNTPGSSVGVSGSGFAPGETVSLSINGVGGGRATADASGTFTGVPFTIPSLPSGTYQLHGTGLGSGADGVYYFYIGGFYPSAFPSTYYLLPGEQLSFTGSGFAPGESIGVFMLPSSTPAVTFKADALGSFTNAGVLTIPVDAVGGAHGFRLLGQNTGGRADLMVTVGAFNAFVSPSAYFLQPGGTLTFSGGGYAPGETVRVYIDSSSTPASTFAAGADGSFIGAGAVTIPFNFAGSTHAFTLTGSSSHAGGTVSIGVAGFYPSISPSSYYVTPGQTFTVSGSGFAGGENVSITMNGGAATVVAASSTGEFTGAGPFTAPFNGTTLHLVAIGQSSNISAPVDVTLGSLHPSLAPDTYYVLSGGKITFSGTGFAPGENVILSSSGSILATSTADELGSFAGVTVTTAFGPDRTVVYTVTGDRSGAAATASVTVAAILPIVSSDSYYTTPGTTVHITGVNFSPNEAVTVMLGSATASGTADSSGVASSVPVTIPFDIGTASVQATMTGGSSGASGFTTITLAPFYPGVMPSVWYTAPGSEVSFTGSGFAANETVTAALNGSSVGTASTTESGTFTLSDITIPLIATSAHFVFTGSLSKAPAAVEVGLSGFSPQIAPSTWYAAPGSKINFTGSGFAPGETVDINFNGTTGTSTADALGAFTSSDFTVPFGTTNIHATFTSSLTHVTQAFDIGVAALSPSIWLSTYYDHGGQPLTVYGGGFGGNETVRVTFGGSDLGNVTTDAGGNFALDITVPFAAAGDKTIQARGTSSSVSASATFIEPEVYVNIQLGSYAGAPGSNVTFIGSGYLPNEPITITTNRTGSATARSFTADTSGSFSDSGYFIPSDFAEGPVTFTIKGTHSFTSKDIVYYVTGQ